jgi:hypothetical protein
VDLPWRDVVNKTIALYPEFADLGPSELRDDTTAFRRMQRPRSKLYAEPFLHSALHLFLRDHSALFNVLKPAFDFLSHVNAILDVFERSVVGDLV